jgi:hypothetical protein
VRGLWKELKMRKALRLTLPGVALTLVSIVAHARPAAPQTPPHERDAERDARCRAAAMRYVHPSPDKEHLTEEAEENYEYEGEKKYLRLCGNSDDAFTRSVRESVEGYEATQALPRLLRAARKAGSPESKDPNTYAALASAHEVRYRLMTGSYEHEESYVAGVVAARKTALEEATDLIIDAYARAVAACGAEARCQTQKADWTKRLTELYAARHGGSDAGLRETIDGALGKPLPRPYLPWWLER